MKRILLILIMVVCSLELFCRGWDRLYPERIYRDYLLEPSPAYLTASYWSESFKTELANPDWPIGCNYQNPHNYHSTYFNVEGHCERRVLNQATKAEHTLWLIGNSTLYSAELPDEHTIASQLQLLLPNWQVKSISTSASGMSGMLTMIEDQPIQAGDTVITYLGMTDAAAAYDDLRRLPGDELFEQMCRVLIRQRNQVYAIRPFCDWQRDHIPASLLKDEIIVLYAKDMEARYKESVENIRSYVTDKGAQYFNVLQPHLWSRSLSESEKIIEANHPFISPRMGEVIRVCWTYLQPYADIDLTHTLDDLRDSEVVFFDAWHGNHNANKLVAAAIAESLKTLH